MSGIRLGGHATAEQPGSLPYIILEIGSPTPWYFNIWRVINGVPTRLTPFQSTGAADVGLEPDIDGCRISPDGNWVALAVNWQGESPFAAALYTSPADAPGAHTSVWDDGGFEDWLLHPTWHPDSDQIVFAYGPDIPPGTTDSGFAGSVMRAQRTAPGPPTELWVPDIQSPVQREGAYRPLYSPDGSQISFLVNVDGGGGGDTTRQGLWVMDADGSNDQLIAAFDDVSPTAGRGYLFRGQQHAWSNDGEWLAFIRNGFGGGGEGAIYKVRPDGTDEMQLTDGVSDTAGLVWALGQNAWVPGDSAIIATTVVGSTSNPWAIHSVPVDGSGMGGGTTELVPASPDGTSGDYLRAAHRNPFTGRLEWVNVEDPGTIKSSLIDGTDIQVLHLITDDDPENPGEPVGDEFYDGTGYDWL